MSAPSARCYFEEQPDGSIDRLKKWSQTSWNIPAGRDPGFHRHDVNPLLEKHLPRLLQGKTGKGSAAGLSVLVPLCGKSRDLIYLSHQGLDVVGVEGVTRAIMELRAEQRCRGLQGLSAPKAFSLGQDGWERGARFEPADTYQGSRAGFAFKKGARGLGYYAERPQVWDGEVFCYEDAQISSRPLHVIQGDMFEVTPALVERATRVEGGTFDLVYDRGSMVAIPPSAREHYAAVLSDLVKPGGRVLMVALDYDQSRAEGPPFSLTLQDVRRAFPSSAWTVEVLDEPPSDLTETNPKFRGVPVTERVLLITRRQPGEGRALRLLGYAGAAAFGVGAVLGLLGLRTAS